MKRDTTDFGPPVVAQGVNPADPLAQRYGQQAQERRQAQNLPKYTTPVGGHPAPPIPALDQPHQAGLTMADHAIAARTPVPGPQGGIINPPPMAQGMPLFPSDILPAEAREDKDFREGAGAMLAMNQPNLAARYGVIRNGKKIPAQQLQVAPGRAGLKSETVEGLKAVEEFNKSRRDAESGNTRIEAEAASGTAGAAARIAGEPSTAPASMDDVRKKLDGMDDFDFNAFRQAMLRDMLNNEEQRKLIEGRLSSMDLTDLIMRGFITQIVPIVPGKFEPEFQSLSTEDDLALKRMVMEETKSLDAPAQYMLDKFAVMSAALGVRAINKKQLPEHRDNKGNFDEDMFRAKFNLFVKYPFHMVASLGIHYFWFDIRVRKLFVAETIKNG